MKSNIIGEIESLILISVSLNDQVAINMESSVSIRFLDNVLNCCISDTHTTPLLASINVSTEWTDIPRVF